MPQKSKTKPAIHGMIGEAMQRAYGKVSKEMPDVKPIKVSSSDDSIFTKILQPKGALATANPFTSNITFNPAANVGQSQDEMENTMAHEMTHVKQFQKKPLLNLLGEIPMRLFGMDEKVPEGSPASIAKPYYWRPDEMEAYQAERDRSMRNKTPNPRDPVFGTTDIDLPRERSPKLFKDYGK